MTAASHARPERALDMPDLRADPADRADLRRRGRGGRLLVLVLLLAAVALGWYWWSGQASAPAPQPVVQQPMGPVPDAPAPVEVVEPTIKYPLPAASAAAVPPQGVRGAITGLVGQGGAAAFLLLDDFPRRFVATVDKLGREHAPPAAWPVLPTSGRFTAGQGADGAVLVAENAARYAPFVAFVDAIDAGAAVALYRQLYPHFQQAYRDLGFGDRYFNDRLVQVIDLLLATPEPPPPVRLALPEVKGPVPLREPWLHYEFADPQLQSLSAGQKILLRMGPVHAQHLKAKLAQLRAQLVQGAAAPPAR
jgi:hypothetical protein